MFPVEQRKFRVCIFEIINYRAWSLPFIVFLDCCTGRVWVDLLQWRTNAVSQLPYS